MESWRAWSFEHDIGVASIWPDSIPMALEGGLHVLDYRGLFIGCVSAVAIPWRI